MLFTFGTHFCTDYTFFKPPSYFYLSRYELVDSESQWKEVQRKQAEGSTGIQQATVISSSKEQQSRPRSGYMNSGMETESEHSYHHRRKHRKHR